MEEVLDLYARPLNPDEPLVCMDEASKELHAHATPPLPVAPGRPARQDDKYVRHGTRAVFMFFAPLLGWRRAVSRRQRTRVDWAHEVRRLLDEDFPKARLVQLVCDNLNTHQVASLYEAFPAAEAHRLARRLRITHTPRNGSWLNVAEIELSVLSSQCTARRIPDAATLDQDLATWTAQRNADGSKVTWHFTTADARVKLRHLYPQH
jgi:DDE superfamily endonuclease